MKPENVQDLLLSGEKISYKVHYGLFSWGRQNNAPPLPKDVHALTPRTCKCVQFYGSKGFADVIKNVSVEKLFCLIQVGQI